MEGMSLRGAAEPGRYRTARAPYLREIMGALLPRRPAQRISFTKAAQVGATEVGNNCIGFVIQHGPGPMLAVLSTVKLERRTSRGRLDLLISEFPALHERVNPARSRDAGNPMLSEDFPGRIRALARANSATACVRCPRAISSSSRSMPILLGPRHHPRPEHRPHHGARAPV